MKHWGWVSLVILALFSILFSLSRGSTVISGREFLTISFGHGNNELLRNIILDIRLPRTLSAFITGGLLALAGALMQILLRNPLADPYILGISGGGAIVSLMLIILGVSGYGLTGGAWFGSLIATFLVFFFTKRQKTWNTHQVLLTGIALSSGFSAIISFILVLSSNKEWHSLLFWLLGDLSFAHMPYLEGSILLLALLYSSRFAKELNLLSRGEREAKALGVNTTTVQIQIYFLSALLTASAVALAGCIGFIGLIIPHVLRLLGYRDHRLLLPGCALIGGTLLTIADTLSRTLFSPEQLPVGIIMAFIGVPIFIFLLHKSSI
ncbi:MAG: iron ABC transporter permease [Gammaproteobacteria bacterium]|nr:iron ABC transporter permease [Gammaproteobacteria bacterium]